MGLGDSLECGSLTLQLHESDSSRSEPSSMGKLAQKTEINIEDLVTRITDEVY